MSYFRNMVKAPDDLVLRFSWEVNGHGEVVVWSLDAEGRRIKMAAAPAVDMLKSLVAVGGDAYGGQRGDAPNVYGDGDLDLGRDRGSLERATLRPP